MLELEWTPTFWEKVLCPGESFELYLTDQFGRKAEPEWYADCEGVVEISGNTITALEEGSVLLTCEWEGNFYDCYVEVRTDEVTWTISHTDVTIKVGESFRLRLRGSDGTTAPVEWLSSKSGVVAVSGNTIKGKSKGTVTVSCEYDGQVFECVVRVK
jgi:hypothetical protein